MENKIKLITDNKDIKLKRKGNKFSVIIICYNLENYIERAINSVLNQSLEDFELIVVDNNSVDKSLSIIRRYQKKYGFKVVTSKRNTGVGGARNLGMQCAKGEYVIYLDGDDTLYSDNTLLKINKLIGKDKPDIIYLGYQEIGGKNRLFVSNAQNSTKKARILCDVTFSACSKCWRREFLEENDIKFIEDMYYEDMIYSLKATILAEKTKHGKFSLINYYRDRDTSVMHIASVKKCSDMYRVLAHIMDLYEITPNSLKKYLLSFILNEADICEEKIPIILDSIEKSIEVPLLPKRDFKLRELPTYIDEDMDEGNIVCI